MRGAHVTRADRLSRGNDRNESLRPASRANFALLRYLAARPGMINVVALLKMSLLHTTRIAGSIALQLFCTVHQLVSIRTPRIRDLQFVSGHNNDQGAVGDYTWSYSCLSPDIKIVAATAMAPGVIPIEVDSSTPDENDQRAFQNGNGKSPGNNNMKYHQLLLASLASAGTNTSASPPIGMEGALTTANVPREFLRDVYLVGQVPMMALQADRRVSYALYVPEAHYNPDPSRYPGGPARLPLLVDVHGTTRVVTGVYEGLRGLADSAPCAVLAPLFPAGVEGPQDLDSYKVLRSRTLRADLALLAALDEVAWRWPGIDAGRVYMAGFSGGGQFAHRFLYLYPERLAAVSVGAPGRVTSLDPARAWPQGVADVAALFDGRAVDRDRVARVPIQLVVGAEDTEPHGSPEFWRWLAKLRNGTEDGGGGGTDLPDMDQSRLKTLQDLQAAWKEEGIDARLDVVPGMKHEAAKARDTVLDFLRPLIQKHGG